MILGTVFLGIKFTEYLHKWNEFLVPGLRFAPTEGIPAGVSLPHVEMFFCFLFFYDLAARNAHDHWPGDSDDFADHGLAQKVFGRLLRARRGQRALLAFRGHRVDLPVPAIVFDRRALPTWLNTSSR